MNTIYSNNNQNTSEPELTLRDVISFVIKAKWFTLAGIAIGIIVTSVYLASIPTVYQSSVTIRLQPIGVTTKSITPAELMENLSLTNTAEQLNSLIQPVPNNMNPVAFQDAIKTATFSKTGNLITFNIKSDSSDDAKKFALQLANAFIDYLNELNAPKIAQLKKTLTYKKSILASANKMADTFNLQDSIFELELTLSSQENFKPVIVEGPSIGESPISPKSKPLLLLGALLGLALGLGLFYLKAYFSKK